MRWIKADTIMKKGYCLIIGVGLMTALMIQIAMPKIFYHMMNSYIAQNISSIMCANTISQSYIWRGNNTVFVLYTDQEAQDMIFEYHMSEDEGVRESLREQILSKLHTQKYGYPSHQIPGDGAIVATTYSMIYVENGDVFYQDEAEEVATVLLDSGWLTTLSMDMDMIYSPVLGDDSFSVICFVVPFSANGLNCYGVHMMDFSYILALFDELENIGIHDFCMLQNERILYQNTDYEFQLDSYPEYMFNQLQYQTSVLSQKDGMDFMTLCSYEGENMKIAVHADRDTLLEPYRNIILLIECLMYGIILLMIVLILFLLRQLLRRLTVLSKRIERVTKGNYDLIPEDDHDDEIGRLTGNFNVMVQTIQSDMERRIAQEKKEQEMQYSLLVSAIDPHFIYNTLNIITFLAHMGKTEEITKVNTALIGTLKDRLAIKNSRVYDTIEAEREVLSQYMLIQRYLCHNTIDYQFEVNEKDRYLLIPKNILQPIVENSIKHGLLPHKDRQTHQILDGKIVIHAQSSGSELLITVWDNGVGISRECIEKYFECPPQDMDDTEVEHIGIYNIRKRLSYLYNDQYRLEVKSVPGEGCTILLALALKTS